jgi:hypothetical protein
MAVKIVNNIAGPNELVLTLLVFETYSRLFSMLPLIPSIIARAKVVRKTMAEVRKIKAQRQVAGAIAIRNGPNIAKVAKVPFLWNNLVSKWVIRVRAPGLS